jgi:hypothetical protein
VEKCKELSRASRRADNGYGFVKKRKRLLVCRTKDRRIEEIKKGGRYGPYGFIGNRFDKPHPPVTRPRRVKMLGETGLGQPA